MFILTNWDRVGPSALSKYLWTLRISRHLLTLRVWTPHSVLSWGHYVFLLAKKTVHQVWPWRPLCPNVAIITNWQTLKDLPYSLEFHRFSMLCPSQTEPVSVFTTYPYLLVRLLIMRFSYFLCFGPSPVVSQTKFHISCGILPHTWIYFLLWTPQTTLILPYIQKWSN